MTNSPCRPAVPALIAMLGLCLTLAQNAWCRENEWRLVYEDDFEDGTVSNAWVPTDSRPDQPGQLAVNEDGMLFYDGTIGCSAMLNLRLPPDVKVEWDGYFPAEFGPTLIQHAIGLRAVGPLGALSGVHFVHGRARCSLNRIELSLLQTVADVNKGPLPQPGGTYHFEATVDGNHATLKRDGEIILDGIIKENIYQPLGDRIIVSLGPRRIHVDNVKVYAKGRAPALHPANYELPLNLNEQGLPAFAGSDPEGHIAAVMDLHYANEPGQALAAAKAIEPAKQKLDALMMLTTDLENPEYQAVCRTIAQWLQQHPELEPPGAEHAVSLQEAADRMQFIVRRTGGLTRSRRTLSALWLIPRLDSRHPFLPKALLACGKAFYWTYKEGRQPKMRQQAERYMTQLLELAPANAIARIYLGENVLWDPELADRSSASPQWAQTLREIHTRGLRIIRWWKNRQAPNGSLGGGWGDDVELTRNWAPVIAITQDPEAYAILEKLIDGAWESAEGGLKEGYTRKMFDVEHTAEPTADTQPWLLLFEPNQKKSVERNRKLLPLVRDLWTDISPAGYRRMKSVYFTAEEVDASRGFRADVPYATRAFKGLTWLMWHSRHPDIRQVWCDLVDGWLEAAMREEDGKIAGIVPAGVDWQTDKLGGPGTWWETGIGKLYVVNIANQMRTFQLLTVAYEETGDRKFMAPLFQCIKIWRSFNANPEVEPELYSKEWQRWMIYNWAEKGHFAPVLLRYRRVSGDDGFDDYLHAERNFYTESRFDAAARRTNPLVKYHMEGELAPLTQSMEYILENQLRYNFPMLTSEVQATDRAAIPGSTVLFGLMTGATAQPTDAYTPDLLVSWEHPNSNFAALVRSNTPGKVEIDFYNFDTDSETVGMRLWNLPFANYDIHMETRKNNAWQSQDKITVQYANLGQLVDLKLPQNQHSRIRIRKQ